MSAEVECLRDRVEELEGLLGIRAEFPRPWGLTPREAAVFGVLLSRNVCNTEAIFASVWGNDSDVDDSRRIVWVYVHHLRKKLAPLGIIIECHRPGYLLTPAMKRAVRELIAAHEARYAA